MCSVVQYFGVNRKSFNNIAIRENAIDVSIVEECQPAAADVSWIDELHLTVKEQNILLGKSWRNGSIINAAMVGKACCWRGTLVWYSLPSQLGSSSSSH